MATTITVLGDTIKIDKAFVSGKDRVNVNGHVVYEGKFPKGMPQSVESGSRTYEIESKVINHFYNIVIYELFVFEGTKNIHSGVYDTAGKPVVEAAAKKSNRLQVCGAVGGFIGIIAISIVGIALTGKPGFGAVGGAIGAGVGYPIGYGIGLLIYGRS